MLDPSRRVKTNLSIGSQLIGQQEKPFHHLQGLGMGLLVGADFGEGDATKHFAMKKRERVFSEKG